MTRDAILRIAQTAGLAMGDQELRSKLTLFALLIEQERSSQLIAMFQEFAQSELRNCAQACRSAGHNAAADMLLAHAKTLVVSPNRLTLHQLSKD